jgi:hypothetical protein
MKLKLLSILLMLPFAAFAQLTINQAPTGGPLPPAAPTATQASLAWYRGGNAAAPGLNNIFGTFWNSEVHHYTNGSRKFSTTVNAGLTNFGFASTIGTLNGDGISIANNPNAPSNYSLDLFTAAGNGTTSINIRMGPVSLMQVIKNRFEHYANIDGFWYNATGIGGGQPKYIWNMLGVEKGRLGPIGGWRFGNNPTNILNAGNVVEISTQGAAWAPYGVLGSGLRFRNLTSASAIIPHLTNGVNANKLLTVDQNGDVVLTSPIAATVNANEGLQVNGAGFVQWGGDCTNPVEVNAAALSTDRKILMKGRNIFFEEMPPTAGGATGRIGIGDFPGCIAPGNLVHIVLDNTNPSTSGVSGLRLGDLQAGAFVQPPNGMSLSVDPSGDVILVQAAPGGGNVNSCGIPIDKVTKSVGGNTICETNITDQFPLFNQVGINNTSPNDALDVGQGISSGNIDVNNSSSAYEINDREVLWHKGVTNNLYVGVDAGASIVGGPGNGQDNTLVGYSAASANNLANSDRNTMVGAEAGVTLVNANNNTYVGYHTGFNANGMQNNTYIGAEAGANNAPGADENTLVGHKAGMNIAGLHNVCIGNNSGINNSGFQNTFVGLNSGGLVSGSFNVSLGGGSGPGVPTINNSIAIGDGATTMNSDNMILGINTVNVGIGLSGNGFGPQNKLEINTTLGSPYFGNPAGSSGLRFRNMIASTVTLPNPGAGVLSVDNNGDVIYVDAATGNANLCGAAPVNNVVKVTPGNVLCQTNITDLHPIPFVGINFLTPNDALDVSDAPGSTGDIDIVNPVYSYQIGDNPVLWHKGNTDNIYVGVGAGNLNTLGTDDVVIGKDAAPNGNDIGVRMTIVGKEAGFNLGSGGFGGANDYTLIGYRAGYDNLGASTNTMIGSRAGYHDLGDENVFVGWMAGHNVPGGGSVHNTFVGNVSGLNNVTGSNNTFIGIGSGMMNTIGMGNVALGAGAGPAANNLTNTSSIGAGASASGSNTLILGDNFVNVGIGLSAPAVPPATKLEIDAGLAGTAPGGTGNNGNSGLRFRDLTSLSIPQNNPGNGVLALNNQGDVIYVNAPVGGGGGVGNYCNAAPNGLLFHHEIPMNNFRYYFPGQGTINAANKENIVSVGYACWQMPPSHFSVLESQTGGPTIETYAGHFQNDNQSQIGFNYITGGVYAEARGPQISAIANPPINVGGHFEGYGTEASIGAFGRIARNSIPYPNSVPAPFARYAIGGAFMSDTVVTNPIIPAVTNIGVYGHASNSNVMNAGVYAHVPLSTGVGNYAVYAESPIGPSNYAGFFVGDILMFGTGTAIGGIWTPSDQRFKKQVKGLDNSLDILMKLRPTEYLYDTKNPYGIPFTDKRQYGFIAQELETVLPELVRENLKTETKDKDGKVLTQSTAYKTVNYDGIIPFVVKGVQEQQAEIESQSTALSTLKTELENQKKLNQELLDRMGKLEQLLLQNAAPTVRQEVSIGNPASIVLNQNVPNPFAEKTLISYVIPRDAKTAQIHFLNNQGASIKVVELTERGKGELLVYAEDLSTGIYTYTLVVDGNVMDSKKMLKQ